MKAFVTLLLLMGLLWIPGSLQAQQPETTSFDPAFAHVVYFWLHHPDNPGDCGEFEAAARELMARSRHAKTHFLGRPPRATREVVDDSFTYNMILTFESAAAQEAYQKEQAHLDFIAKAGHLWKKVVVYDAMGLTP